VNRTTISRARKKKKKRKRSTLSRSPYIIASLSSRVKEKGSRTLYTCGREGEGMPKLLNDISSFVAADGGEGKRDPSVL